MAGSIRVIQFNQQLQVVRNKIKWVDSIFTDLIQNFRGEKISAASPIGGNNSNLFLTGSLGGIGEMIVFQLTGHCKEITITGRTSKTQQLENLVTSICKGTNRSFASALGLDLDTFLSGWHTSALRLKFRTQHSTINHLIHAAGLMSKYSSDEEIYNVNAYSPFALSLILLPELLSCSNSSIVFVTSSSHLRGTGYDQQNGFATPKCTAKIEGVNKNSLVSYAESKLQLMMASTALLKRLKNADISTRILFVHPGLVDTPMVQGFFGKFPFWGRSKIFRSPLEGSASILIPLFESSKSSSVLHDNIEDNRAVYFVDGRSAPTRCSPFLNDEVGCEACYTHFIQRLPPLFVTELIEKLKTASHSLTVSTCDGTVAHSHINRRYQTFLAELACEIKLINAKG